MSVSANVPPVTVLCGFLGAGKTTVLNHLLSQSEGRRWALVVNDVGSINIDARLIAQRTVELSGGAGRGQPVIELGNGCVCCSIKDELAESLAELAMTGRPGGPPGDPYDHIIVEATGVAEPRGVAQLFIQRNPFGRSLADLAALRSLVTVVDASHFLGLWNARVTTRPRGEIAGAGETARDLFDLMLDQVETADLIVVNKCDLVSEDQRMMLSAAIEGVNPRAELQFVEHGRVSRDVLLDHQRFEPRTTLSGARWLQSLNAVAPQLRGAAGASVVKPRAAAPSYALKYGLSSFVYQARRPFSRARFEARILGGFPGLVRAKGFCWWAESPDEMGFLSVAGSRAKLDTLNFWWASLIEHGRASPGDRPEMIRALWVEPHGDRRQELVFIGQSMDEAAIRSALDQCLVDGS